MKFSLDYASNRQEKREIININSLNDLIKLCKKYENEIIFSIDNLSEKEIKKGLTGSILIYDDYME